MTVWYSNGAVNGNSNHNWNATNAWNQATGGGGTAGNPTDGDVAIIQSGDIVTLTADVTSIGALKIIGTLAGGSGYTITTRAAYANKPVDHDGTITGVVNLRIENQGTGSTPATGWMFDSQHNSTYFTNVFVDLTSATSSHNIVEWLGDLRTSGTITVENGTFAGYNTGYTAVGTDLTIESGGIFGKIDNTETAAYQFSSIEIKSGGTFVATNGTTTVNSEKSDKVLKFNGSGVLSAGTGTILITTSADTILDCDPSAGSFNNLTFNASSRTFTLEKNLTIGGNLTITAGELDTVNAGGTDWVLTVAGDTQIDGGTLTCNASTINLRSGGSGNTWGLRLNSGTFNGGTGTHNIGGLRVQGGSFVWSNGTTTLNGAETSSSASTLYKTSSGTFTVGTGTVVIDTSSSLQWLLYGGDISVYNLTIASGSTLNLWQNTSDGTDARLLTVAGDLTATGGLNTKYSSQDDVNLTVTGKTTITGTLTLNDSVVLLGTTQTADYGLVMTGGALDMGGSDCKTGAVDISGGALTPTTATWEVMSRKASNSNAWISVPSSFTNQGTLKFTSPLGGNIRTPQGMNNVIFDASSGTPTWTIVTQGFQMVNLTITDGTLDTGSNRGLTVTGATSITGTLTCNASAVNLGDNVDDAWSVVIEAGGTFTGGSGTHRLGAVTLNSSSNQFTFSSGTTYLTGRSSSGNQYKVFNNFTAGKVTAAGTQIVDQARTPTSIRCDDTTGINNLTMNSGTGRVLHIENDLTTVGNINISAGTISTRNHQDNTDYDLTSGGYIHGAGTLAANSSDIRIAASNDIQTQMTGVAPDFAASTGGINKFGFNGDVAFTGAMTVTCGSVGGNWTNAGTSTVTISNHNNKTNNQTGSLYNLTINNTGNTTKCSSTQTILGAFTITAGTFDMMNQALTVTGNITVTGILDAHTNGDPAIAGGGFDITGAGTYKATSGNTSITSGNFNNSGTFTHNLGTVKFTHATNTQNLQSAGTAEPTFYKLDNAMPAVGGATVVVWKSITVVHTLSQTGGRYFQFKGDQGSLTVTLGSSAIACTVTEGNRCLATLAGVGPVNIYGADQLKPFVITTGGPNHACTEVHYKWGDYSADSFTTQHNITIDGDMEFGAVTVASGDTLDINGKRMECSGIFTIADGGDVDETGGGLLVLHNNLNILGAINGSNGLNVIVDGGTAHKWNLGQSGGGAHWADVVMTNGTVTHNGGVLGNPGGAHTPRSIIIGNGTFTQSGGNTNLLDITVATDGTFVPSPTDTIVTCEGDFTTSGGLIGKSALNLTGSEEVTGSDNLDEVATTNKFTIEAWFKASTDANYRAIFSRGTSWATGNLYVYMNGDGNVQASANDLSNTLTSTTAGLADGKWHHVAYTYDTTTISLYIDGKLEATAASTSGINTQTAGFKIGDRDGANWVGNIGRVSVWKNALSETLIRKMFFMDWTTMAADSDFTDSDAIGWWQFDEGTSTAVEDLSSQSNDGTLNSAAWAGAGGFTDGSSTLNFTGNGTWSISDTATEYYKVNVAASGKTTTMEAVGTEGKKPIITNLLTHGGGTLTDVNNCSIVFQGTGTVSSGADLSNLYFTTWNSSTAVPELTTKYLNFSRSADFAGNQTAVQYIQFHYAHNLFDYNITTSRIISYNSSSFTMGAGTITFTSTTGWGPNVYDDRSFSAGPGATIKGVGAKSGFASGPNWEVVGDVINLDVTNEELTVAGTVTNCTGDILQWHHSQDYDQRLDTDTADDRDLRLGGPALDNANALNT